MAKNTSRAQAEKAPLDQETAREIAALSQELFGVKPQRIAFPGGKSRSAYLVDAGGRRSVFARRGKRGDATLEANMLRLLEPRPDTPRLIAHSDPWTVQEFVEGTRLPIHLDECETMTQRERAVDLCLSSLADIHAHMVLRRDVDFLPAIGSSRDWIRTRVSAAHRLSRDCGLAEPIVDRDWLVDLMDNPRNTFIKYDARPGNALIDGDRVCWFDWEDCGLGQPVEDLASLLCDEWTSLDASAEQRMVEKHLGAFRGPMSCDEAYHYLLVYGVMHVATRLRMALKYRLRDGDWWDRTMCLAEDKVGNTAEEIGRLTERGTRWAQRHSHLQGFVPWFENVNEHFSIDVHNVTVRQPQAA